ncbi:hypothetical protein D5086_030390 [Populus alba]
MGSRGEAIDQQQLEASIELALRCTNPFSWEDRPLMIEVAKELQRIERSITAAPAEQLRQAEVETGAPVDGEEGPVSIIEAAPTNHHQTPLLRPLGIQRRRTG